MIFVNAKKTDKYLLDRSMLNSLNKKILLPALISFGIILPGCFDLNVENDVDILTEDFFKTEEEYVQFISPAYIHLRLLTGSNSFLALQEISTDEICIPTRGNEWSDGGEWLRLHRHHWTANDFSISSTWHLLYDGVNTCNRLIQSLEELQTSDRHRFIAELRALRGLYYLWLLDLFGNVPIVTSYRQFQMPETSARKELFTFINNELMEVKADLSKDIGVNYGRINYYVIEAMLAQLFLNAEVYSGTANWQQVITHCDEIIQSGHFQLDPDYFAVFDAGNDDSKEIIFAIPYDSDYASGFNISMMTLHPANRQTYQLISEPWNGWCTLMDFFKSYDENDLRKGDGNSKGSFIYGQQFTNDGDTLYDDTSNLHLPYYDPDGLSVNLTPEIRSLDSAYRQDGARVGKFEILMNSDINMDNDFPVFRFARVLMMKAEALWRLGQVSEALTLVNEIRTRAGLVQLQDLDDNEFIAELGREFFMEAQRRTDLIRFGKFTDVWWEKPGSADCMKIYPIPLDQIIEQPNLIQNPCY